MSAGPTLERECRGLADAAREFPRASRHIITLTPEAATAWPDGVTVHAAERWLLTEDHREE